MLTPSEIEQIANATVEKLKAGHACRFSDDEAQVVHGFGRALKEHDAGEKELFVVIQIGKNVTDFFERAGKTILWTVIIGAAAFVLYGLIPWKMIK